MHTSAETFWEKQLECNIRGCQWRNKILNDPSERDLFWHQHLALWDP